MEALPRKIAFYRTEGNEEPCLEWLNRLRDATGRAAIRIRLNRVADGNFGQCESVGGGVHELKINKGPGYRVYFGVDGDTVILLNGGDKDSQQRDIPKAKEFWDDYNA